MHPDTSIRRTMNSGEWGILIFLSLLWGSSFFFNGVAVKELPTLTIVFCRVFFGALILYAAVRMLGIRMPSEWRVWRALVLLGFVNNALPFCLIVWGQSHIASGLASILNATTPLFGVVVAHYFTRDEKLTGGRVAGVLLGIAGVSVMIGADALRSLGVGVLAQLAVLCAALCYATGSVYARRFKVMGVSPLATATGQVAASSAMIAPMMLVVDRPWTLPMPGLETVGALAGVAALSTSLAYFLYFGLLSRVGATNILLVTFLVPVTATLLGILLLGERLFLQHGIGMALIAAGLAVIDGRLTQKLLRRSAKTRGAPT